MATPEPKNVVIRQPNPGQGQGQTRAISARTAWQYEHDETDEQIDKIEEIILSIREEEGITTGDSLLRRAATFSWTPDDNGNIHLGTMYKADETPDALWICEWWTIAPGGTVIEEGTE